MRSDWRSARRPAVVEDTKNVRVDWAWGMLTRAKARQFEIKRSRGFENPRPRTEVRGWHSWSRPRPVRGWHTLAAQEAHILRALGHSVLNRRQRALVDLDG